MKKFETLGLTTDGLEKQIQAGSEQELTCVHWKNSDLDHCQHQPEFPGCAECSAATADHLLLQSILSGVARYETSTQDFSSQVTLGSKDGKLVTLQHIGVNGEILLKSF